MPRGRKAQRARGALALERLILLLTREMVALSARTSSGAGAAACSAAGCVLLAMGAGVGAGTAAAPPPRPSKSEEVTVATSGTTSPVALAACAAPVLAQPVTDTGTGIVGGRASVASGTRADCLK